MNEAEAPVDASYGRLIAAGASHRCADLGLRERLAVSAWQLAEALADFKQSTQSSEVVLLSTCNRTEVYLVADHPIQGRRAVVDAFARRSGLNAAEMGSCLYIKEGMDAATHLLRVASGLDSMILGESEIVAQVKHAYAVACESRTTGPILNRLFQKAAHTAKLARTRTGIGQGHASIGSIVVDAARDGLHRPLHGCEALIWGAGKAAQSCARHLIDAGIAQLWIVSRTRDKAQALADSCRANWLSWEQAHERLAHVDLAVVCTQAPHHVVDRWDMERLSAQRSGRPLVLVDLSVPRNVEPSIREMPGVCVYDMEDVQTSARRTWHLREQAVEACEAIISNQARRFLGWMASPAHKEERSC